MGGFKCSKRQAHLSEEKALPLSVAEEVQALPVSVAEEVQALPLSVAEEVQALPLSVAEEVQALPLSVAEEVPLQTYAPDRSCPLPPPPMLQTQAVPSFNHTIAEDHGNDDNYDVYCKDKSKVFHRTGDCHTLTGTAFF